MSGDPWIGKSALLFVLGELARERGWTVASGAAGPLPETLPFGVFSDALDDLLGPRREDLVNGFPEHHLSWLAGIYPALAPCAQEATLPENALEMHHAFHAVRALLDGLSLSGRLLLIMDDMHWADETSIRLLMHLVRRSPAPNVLLAVGHRPRQVRGELRTLLEEGALAGRVARIHLAPLPEERLDALLPAGLDPSRRQALRAESGGNPGLLQALAALRAAEGPPGGPPEPSAVGPPLLEGAAGGPPLGSPVCLLREFRGLSPLGWAAAHAAALVREPFDTHLLETVAQLDEEEVWAGVDELVRHDILRLDETERSFRFRNALLRATAYQAAGAAWRLGAHARAAAALRTRRAPLPQIARHLRHSLVTRDEESVRILVGAARAVLWEQPHSAALWLRTVANLQPYEEDPGRGEHLGPLSLALALSGDLTGALELFRRPEAEPAGEGGEFGEGGGQETLWHARVLRLLGRPADAVTLLGEALPRVGPREHLARARLHAGLLAATFDVREANGLGVAGGLCGLLEESFAADVAAAREEPALRVSLLALHALADAGEGVEERARERAREAVSLVEGLSGELLAPQLDCLYWLGRAESRLGADGDAVRHLERALRLASAYGQHFLTPRAATSLASVLLRAGDLAGAALHAEHAQRAARRVGSACALAAATGLRERVEAGEASAAGSGSGAPRGAAGAGQVREELALLSGREREISELVSDGRTNQQIARALGLSHKTVETYLARIFKKLGICSRAQLAAMVGRSGGWGTVVP